MNIYSDWFKVDLHIHTDYSKKTKVNDYQGNFSITVLKQKLKDNNVELFSMTDHNIINTAAYKWYYDNYEEGDPKLLLGCEFDIEVPESNKKTTYHSLIFLIVIQKYLLKKFQRSLRISTAQGILLILKE